MCNIKCETWKRPSFGSAEWAGLHDGWLLIGGIGAWLRAAYKEPDPASVPLYVLWAHLLSPGVGVGLPQAP